MHHPKITILTTAASVACLALAATLPAQAQSAQGQSQRSGSDERTSRIRIVTSALTGPRGVDAVTNRKILVTQIDGTFSRVVRRPGLPAKVVTLGHVPNTGFSPAIAKGLHRTVWILTGGSGPEAPTPVPGAATLYRWRPGWAAPRVFADIGAFQTTHPDPFNLADAPGESNPFGVVALPDGSVLVSDAAGNDLLRVKRNRHIQEVAMLKPRVVAVPTGLPATDPEGHPLPPAGTMIPSEDVATSVTVGRDGFWYVGELRGFPATPGTSQIWRIKPGTTNAVCDPEHPRRGHCKRYKDGLTSIVDLGTGRHGIYAVEISKMGWFKMELAMAGANIPGALIGGLFYVHRVGDHKVITELAKDKLQQPGGVDVAPDHSKYVTGPVFGPGNLYRIH